MNLNTLLDESIAEGLEVLGKDMYKVVLYHVLRSRGIGTDEMADRIEEFVDGMEEIFGEGSKVLERLILERLNSKVGLLRSLNGDWSLKDYVQLCNRAYEVRVGRSLET